MPYLGTPGTDSCYQSYLAKGKTAPVVPLPYEVKWKYLFLHGTIRTGSD